MHLLVPLLAVRHGGHSGQQVPIPVVLARAGSRRRSAWHRPHPYQGKEVIHVLTKVKRVAVAVAGPIALIQAAAAHWRL